MTTLTGPANSAIEFGGAIPILRVMDVAASVEYYVSKLGFKVNWGFPDSQTKSIFASISRGQCRLFLSAGDQGNPGTWVWIDGKNVERLHAEFKASGARIRHAPTNYSWALEMQVEDLDGNVLRIGSDPKAGEPVGEWLDMHRQRWRPESDGTWTLVQAE